MMTFDESDYPNSLTGTFCIGLDMAGTPTKAQNLDAKKYFRLKQNYPNPFSGTTNIKFSMLSAGTVRLSVFNNSGELAAQLMNRHLASGDYTVTFDRKTRDYFLAPGTYLFDMIVDNSRGRFRQSQHLVIV